MKPESGIETIDIESSAKKYCKKLTAELNTRLMYVWKHVIQHMITAIIYRLMMSKDSRVT